METESNTQLEQVLEQFTGGIMYFRTDCFEVGPDLYYLFRYRVNRISILPDGGIRCDVTDMYPNRYTARKWIDHPTDPAPRVYKRCIGKNGGADEKLPLITPLTPTMTRIKIDMVANAIVYARPEDVPSDENPMRDFTRAPAAS
jgi:hypothetical protein